MGLIEGHVQADTALEAQLSRILQQTFHDGQPWIVEGEAMNQGQLVVRHPPGRAAIDRRLET